MPNTEDNEGDDAGTQQQSTDRSRAEETVMGKAFVGSICFDGNSIEASVHWLGKSQTSNTRKYDIFSLRVATGNPFAADLEEYQATYKKIANFMDWMVSVRNDRLKEIMKLLTNEPKEIALPEPDFDPSDSVYDSDDDEGGGAPSQDEPSTSNSQPMQDLSLGSFDGAAEEGSQGAVNTSNRPAAGRADQGASKRRHIAGAVRSAAQAAAKKLKHAKR